MEDLVVDGRFDVERRIGEGAMGVVYRAKDQLTGQPVAVKVMQRKAGSDDRRFEREAKILAQLRHPAIVRYVAHGTSQGRPYLAMEWLEGETLEARLERGALGLAECVALGIRITEALTEAHRHGVVHRDLKPANLFMVGGRVEETKVLDFGVARWQWDARALTATGSAIGTLLYMSPEQARGQIELDARSDLFSLGVVLQECLTGRAPFMGHDAMVVLVKILSEPAEPLLVLRPDAPAALERLLAAMLAKEPGARPESAVVVRGELAAIREALGDVEVGAIEARPVQARDEESPVNSSAMSRAEQRVVSLLLVRADRPVADGVGSARTERLSGAPRDGNLEATRASPRDTDLDGRRDPPGDLLALKDLQAVVAPHEGRVDALIDGSLMVTVSSSTPKEQAIRAARCALSLQRLVGQVPMAICTGQAVVRGRASIGEVIERAARGLAEGGGAGIRVDEPTVGLLEGRFAIEARPHGGTLLGEREAPSESRTLLGKVIPCLGRERDLEMLHACFRECVDESVSRAVLVTAPAGQGKTRLLHELLRRLRATAGFQLLLASADSLGTGASFGMLAPALRAMAGIASGAPLEAQRERVRAFFGRGLGEEAASRVSVFLGELMGVPFEESAWPALADARQAPRVMADQMRVAWLDWLDAECARGPVLLVLEDVHWADLASVQYVEGALSVRDRPLMVLGLARPEVIDRFPGLWSEHDLVTISLSGLSRKAADRLVVEALGDRIDAERRGRLVDRAQGNPFYLEELIRAVDAGADDAAVPVAVLGMVHARLDALGDEARHVLRAASVFGVEFSVGGVKAVLGARGSNDAAAWLGLLTEREVIHARTPNAGRRTYAFRHALVREAAYALWTEGDRALAHRLAAQWLESEGETQATVVADHFERGGAPSQAARWYLRAATQAIEGNDLTSVIACCERGIACGAEGELLGELSWLLADARQWRGEYQEATGPAVAAMRLLQEGSAPWYRAAGALTSVYACLAQVREAEDLARRVIDACTRTPCEGAGAMGVAHAAHELFFLERSELANRLLAFAERAAERPGASPLVVGWVNLTRGMREGSTGRTEAMLPFADAAAAAFHRAGDLRAVYMAQAMAASSRIDLGAFEDAERGLVDAEMTEQRLRLRLSVPIRANQSLLALYRGRSEEATRLARNAIALAQRGDPVVPIIRCYLARALAAAGQIGEAEREVRAGIDGIDRVDAFSSFRPMALATLAAILLLSGRIPEAFAESARAVEALESSGSLQEASLVRRVHAEALHASGRIDEARAFVARARDELVARAATITDAALRQSFLERIPDNARIAALTREWGA